MPPGRRLRLGLIISAYSHLKIRADRPADALSGDQNGLKCDRFDLRCHGGLVKIRFLVRYCRDHRLASHHLHGTQRCTSEATRAKWQGAFEIGTYVVVLFLVRVAAR